MLEKAAKRRQWHVGEGGTRLAKVGRRATRVAAQNEVEMSGRRSHARFAVNLAAAGTLRVFRDVHVQAATAQELIAVSAEPCAVGQRLSINVLDDYGVHDEPVEVIESSPVSIEGGIRHRLRLRRLATVEAQPAGAEASA
jgi:hypothetical protein